MIDNQSLRINEERDLVLRDKLPSPDLSGKDECLVSNGHVPKGKEASLESVNNHHYQFPEYFVWGVAAAAAQIEGGANEEGKGDSIWDRFASQPGAIVGGNTPAVACDHFHRYPEDFQLMSKLGIRNYRLSISWPRIIPEGQGSVNEKGLAFYDRLIDSMLENSIVPWITLFHWDLPQLLEERNGGWRARSTAEAFETYACVVVKRFADRVKNWMTVNEIPCFIGKGYGQGEHAPGRQESPKVLNQCYHHALLAHGYAVGAVREFGGVSARVGLVHNPETPVPVTETPENIRAARILYMQHTSQIMAPIFKGGYLPEWLERLGKSRPDVAAGDLTLIGQKTDFLGLNVYGGSFCRAAESGVPQTLPLPMGYPRANLDWLNITPQAMYWAVRHAAECYGIKEFYITENGFSQEDTPDDKGIVHDLGRREFYRNYLISLQRAIVEKYNVKGFFAWSFMDNYEWAEGYAKRFGIVHVDYETQKRTPKLSAEWYSQVIAQNAVL